MFASLVTKSDGDILTTSFAMMEALYVFTEHYFFEILIDWSDWSDW